MTTKTFSARAALSAASPTAQSPDRPHTGHHPDRAHPRSSRRAAPAATSR
ncbi:hypothetical protein ACFPM0_21555 [Pseudonocardia sulfidoxydans]